MLCTILVVQAQPSDVSMQIIRLYRSSHPRGNTCESCIVLLADHADAYYE